MSVVDYVGYYEVSDHGRIRSVPRRGTRGSVLKPIRRRDGRLRISLSRGGKVRDFLVHRLVLTAFVGPCPEGKEGCHWDDDPSNNHLSNLRWDTHSSNVTDKRRNGLLKGANKNADYCRKGLHPWVEGNIRVDGRGFGHCRECEHEAQTRYRTQGLPPGDPRHGTHIGGRRGCNCEPCQDAFRKRERELAGMRKANNGD